MHGMPVVTDEHRKLHALVGRWEGEETMSPSPWGPGGKRKGTSTCTSECDGFHVVQQYVQHDGDAVSYRGHGVFGYDVGRKQYAWFWVDSMGFVPGEPSWGTWQGDTLTLTSRSPMGQGRYTYEFSGKERYRFRIENSFDGGKTWQTFMTGDYRRSS